MAIEIKVIGDTVESFPPFSITEMHCETRPEDFPNGQFDDQFRVPFWNAHVTVRASALFCLFS